MNKSTLSLSVALLASVGSAAWLWNALGTERARNAALSARLERQSVELRQVSEMSASAARQSAAAPVVAMPVSSSGATVAAPASTSNAAPGTQEDWDATQRRLLRNPKYREALREQERLKLSPRRANMVRLLGFTPQQADAAIDMEIDQQLLWREDGSTSDPEAMKAIRAKHEAAEREHQDKLRALLGEEKRVRLEGYMESRESRMQVEDLRPMLTGANALRDDQIEPLIAALHVERAQAKAELREYRDTLNWEGVNNESWRLYADRKIELMKAMNSRMLSSASSVLTQPQLDALKEQLRQELGQHEAQQRMSLIQTKLDQPDPSAAKPN